MSVGQNRLGKAFTNIAFIAAACLWVSTALLRADSDVYLTGVPDYTWYAGCFGTACGNLMGYWDRHGMQDFYTNGMAPLNDSGPNIAIRAMWASRAGYYGRPANKPGHIDDYWNYYNSDFSFSYESTDPDPYVLAGRQEHAPDCVADFVGISQRRWTNMNGECDGNIDAYSFVYWDIKGNRRTNYTPSVIAGTPARDIQSGLREWAKYCGYDADVFTQLADFNPQVPVVVPPRGFSFENLKAEINAGYPVLVFLQEYTQYSRPVGNMTRANPEIHGMLIYGYQEYPDFGINYVRYRTSWGSGDNVSSAWGSSIWQAGMPARGFIAFHPKPKVRNVLRNGATVTLNWDGPSSQLYDAINQTTASVHRYQVETTPRLNPSAWTRVGSPTTQLSATLSDCCGDMAFFRVRLLGPGE